MDVDGSGRQLGGVFDSIAAEYDAYRPTYPDDLVDLACAGLAAGDPVLEVGCGSGQLTRSLVARGLQVTAVDPGSRLLALAAREAPGVRFVNAPFEEAELGGQFPAMFSASALHWIDPDVSWSRAAGALSPGGTLALLQYCGIEDDDDQAAQLEALRRAAPRTAAAWPALRSLPALMAGIEKRRANVSEVWSWVAQRDLARAAGRLFDDVRAAAVPVVWERTATELIALLRTLSPYHHLTADQQSVFEASIVDLERDLGRPIRSTTAAVLVTARKAEP
ncbi:MAG TPA: class I SAM-dependent methyltransferase [Actinomycetes bacterium]|nr:class I SAM-dependent methyltransferase [Actinomycetes bacterium]